MQGHFEIGAYHTPGLTQEKLDTVLGPRALRKSGCVLDFLEQHEKHQEVQGKNLVMDNAAALAFLALFSGPTIANPYNRVSVGTTLGFLALTDHSAEPGYQDEYGDLVSNETTINGSIGSGSAKRFYDDEVEPYLISEGTNGKESLTYRGRWLWLPADAVSSDIKSIGAWFRSANGAPSVNQYTGIISRIRLKDSGGNPITINKTSAITLFVEYNITLASV